MIFDTYVLFYLSKHILIPETILTEQAQISVITKTEALGYPFKNKFGHGLLFNIGNILSIIPLFNLVAEKTLKFRAKHKIKLPDAIIYATALAAGQPLLTHNISDFISLNGNVKLIDPF